MDVQALSHIEKLYSEYKDPLFNYLARLSSDQQLALDITQETFVRLMHDPNVAKLTHPKAYLFTVARNLLYDTWKKKTEQPMSDEMQNEQLQVTDQRDTPFEQVRDDAQQHNISQALARLRANYRDLILLHYVEDLSYHDIAHITGRDVTYIKVNLHRARQAFDTVFTTHMYSKVAAARRQCEHLGALLQPFGDNDIPADEMPVIEKHLNKCQVCRDDADQMKRSRQLFSALPLLIAPAFWDKLGGQAQAATLGVQAAGHTATTTASTATSIGILKIAAVVVVTGGVAVGTTMLILNKSAEQPVAVLPAATPATEATPTVPEPASESASAPATTASVTETATAAPAPVTTPAVPVATPAAPAQPTDDPNSWWIYSGEPFAAQYVSKNGDENSSTRVAISSYGIRHEGKNGPVGEYISITNFALRKGWLLDPKRKLYIDVKLDKDGDSELMRDPMSYMDNLFSKRPCERFDVAKQQGPDTIGDRPVVKWHCTLNSTFQVSTQWFDPVLNIVIAEKNDVVGYQALQAIAPQAQAKSAFEIPTDYKEATPNAFFGTNIF